MARHLMSRTRLASHFGLSVPALKKELIAAGILTPDGKNPTLAPHLAEAVSWRTDREDRFARYFLLSRTYLEEVLPRLSEQAEQNRAINIRHKHSAGDLLTKAGNAFQDALSLKEQKACSWGGQDIGWLCYESGMATLVADTPEREIALADRIDAMRLRIEEGIKKRAISSKGEGVQLGLESLKAVAEWYRLRGQGKRKSKTKAKQPSAEKIPLPTIHIYSDEAREAMRDCRDLVVPLSPDEAVLLKSGYTFTTTGTVTGSVARALADATDLAASRPGSDAADPCGLPCHWFRMSSDGKVLLAAVADECLSNRQSDWAYVFEAEFTPDGALSIGKLTNDLDYAQEGERFTCDFDEWLSVHDEAAPVLVEAPELVQ